MDTNILVTKKVAQEILSKVGQVATLELSYLCDVDPYIYFLIMRTPEWFEEYTQRYDFWLGLLKASIDLRILFSSPGDNQVYLPSWMCELTGALPEEPGQMISKLSERNELKFKGLEESGGHQVVLSSILDGFLAKRKIDESFYPSAFEHCMEKGVIEKFGKNKEEQIPLSLDEFIKAGGVRTPKKLKSYVRTSIWRFKQTKKNASPSFQKLTGYEKSDSGIYDLYNFLNDELLLEQLPSLVESTLTGQEKQVIHLRYQQNPPLTQEQIAKRLKVSQQMVSKHESKAYKKLHRAISELKASYNKT